MSTKAVGYLGEKEELATLLAINLSVIKESRGHLGNKNMA